MTLHETIRQTLILSEKSTITSGKIDGYNTNNLFYNHCGSLMNPCQFGARASDLGNEFDVLIRLMT